MVAVKLQYRTQLPNRKPKQGVCNQFGSQKKQDGQRQLWMLQYLVRVFFSGWRFLLAAIPVQLQIKLLFQLVFQGTGQQSSLDSQAGQTSRG